MGFWIPLQFKIAQNFVASKCTPTISERYHQRTTEYVTSVMKNEQQQKGHANVNVYPAEEHSEEEL